MQIKLWIAGAAMGLSLISSSIFAMQEQLQMPRCLADKLIFEHKVLAENEQFKIVEMHSNDLNDLRLLADKIHCGGFVNISHQFVEGPLKAKTNLAHSIINAKPAYSSNNKERAAEVYEIKHQTEVNAALEQIESDNIWQTLSHLVSYRNRSATKTPGVQAANWLKASFDAMATQYGRKDVSSFFINTGGYKQPSLVTVIGTGMTNQPAVIIGAHMDTLDGRMPGAGDDGSGSSSIMEVARVLLDSKMTLKRPVYIIWYAAEERGLVGSQYVVQYFMNNRIPVKAVAQFDMTGYRTDPSDPTMWVYTDYTDSNLNNYIAQLISTYIKVPVSYSSCGYGCSDHASWTERGFPAVFPCETSFKDHNPYIHSSADTMDLLNLEHMTNFSKLALAFIVELASE